MDFQGFILALQSRPHVAVKIAKKLNPVDIANCLKTCKGLRHLVTSTLQQNSQHQDALDEKLSKLAITCGFLDYRHYGPLAIEHFGNPPSQSQKFSFGLDGTLWVFQVKFLSSQSPQAIHDNHTLTIYDLNSGTKLNTFLVRFHQSSRPKINILTGGKVLLQDMEHIRLLERQEKLGYVVVREIPHDLFDVWSCMDSQVDSYGKDFTYHAYRYEEERALFSLNCDYSHFLFEDILVNMESGQWPIRKKVRVLTAVLAS